MAITYTWSVDSMSTLPTPQTDFVVTIGWLCSGVEGAYTNSMGGMQSLPDVEGESFTPYADLTQTQVLQWAYDAMGADAKSNIEACVAGQIDSQKNPIVSPTSEPLPW
jgi:hypothetical protein|tara:strand:- start:93 stop:416 length:324 start_codon:yes stop_codon:yes gene_type:complete